MDERNSRNAGLERMISIRVNQRLQKSAAGECLWESTYCWEETKSEDAQQTCLAASTVANDDQFPTLGKKKSSVSG